MSDSSAPSLSSNHISRGQLTRFVSALTQALYDRMLENKHAISYYYDANVLIPIVLGMEDSATESSPADLKTSLVWGLLSAGYLGKARILRPHAIELENALQRQGKEISVPGFFGTKLQKFLDSNAVKKNVDILFQQIKHTPTEERIETFLELLRDVGPETFIFLERAADGAWQSRLVRLHNSVLSFDEREGSIRAFIEDPLTWKFYDTIKNLRGQKHEAPDSLRDAVAMCQLAKRVSEAHNGNGPLVRFNTRSSTLLSLATSDLGELLTYRTPPVVDGAERWHANVVFRDPDYYVIRASFEALRFSDLNVRSTSNNVPTLTLANLEQLCGRLNYALDADDSRMERLLEEINIGDKRLSIVIGELERLSFVQSVISQYNPPKSLRKAIKGLTEVWDFMETDAPQSRLRADIIDEAAAIGKALSFHVRGLRDWLTCFRQIEHAAQRVASTSRGAEIPDLYRDLGLVRWGEYLQENDEALVIAFCKSLVSGNSTEITRQSAALAWRVDTADSVSACMGTCSLLWMLSLFHRVIDVTNRVQDNLKAKFPVSLNILRTAARLRIDDEFSGEEKSGHVSALEDLAQSEPEDKRGRLLIGLAYVSFYIWLREPRSASTAVSAWAEKSFQHGKIAAELLINSDPLGHAFAVNHCAYVGVWANLPLDQTDHFFSLVEKFRGKKDVWNYRFADTLAFRELNHGMHLWELFTATGPEAEKEQLRRAACDACKRAEQFMVEAQPHFGDLEIPAHHKRIQALLERLGC
jgi:hypothetical protein